MTDVDALVQVLNRTRIRRGQITLLKALYDEEGEDVPISALVERIRWGDTERFPGVLRAFGKRINATDAIQGNPGTDAFLRRTRTDGELHYRLRPEARQAIEEIDVLHNAITNHSMSQLRKPGTKIEGGELMIGSTAD